MRLNSNQKQNLLKDNPIDNADFITRCIIDLASNGYAVNIFPCLGKMKNICFCVTVELDGIIVTQAKERVLSTAMSIAYEETPYPDNF